jgi:hypothetical protein
VLNVTEVVTSAFVERLKTTYTQVFGSLKPDIAEIAAWAGAMAAECIATSDALYHDVEHTVLVTLVGQEVLRGKHMREGHVTPEDWLHCVISLACHDIGYVRGILARDRGSVVATGVGEETVTLPPGATDAALTPYHVDRGKRFVEERFGDHDHIDAEVIKRNIELTRFPVPADDDHRDTTAFPGLVRASDLIGQLSDPRYLRKIPALFHEFGETGVNERLGYKTPDDVRRNYATFYWKSVHPFIEPALQDLALTQEGQQITANLHANVFVVEHDAS